MESIKNKISNFFEESSVPPTTTANTTEEIGISSLLRNPIFVTAATIIPVVAGVLYIKDRHKILNANSSSAFMNMGVGNF